MPRLGEHGAGLLRQQTKALVRWHGPVLENRDPEPLHQMRVSMRRLRTTLDQVGPALVLPKWVTAERVAKPLRRLGMARDLDVLGQRLEQGLLPQLAKAEARQLQPVLKQLRRERELALGAGVATLQSSSYLALVAQLQGWLKEPQFSAWGESALDGWVWELQLPALAALFLHPGWLVDELGDQVEAVHGLRIAIKRARYGLEALGPMAGRYRVGPLARLNICKTIGTNQADKELLELRQRGGQVVTASFLYHLARLIEILACLEQMDQVLANPDICDAHVRVRASLKAHEAVGVSEAPRGTLFHHYRVDGDGLIEKVNLIIATGQNNSAMNRTITQIARHYLSNGNLSEALLNRVEAGIRCFDPCLSCSTHAAGQMPLQVQLIGTDGGLLQERFRG
jgi:CHAD domain-containing protein